MSREKSQIEQDQVEKVKRIIRAHNYANPDETHEACQKLGIQVNRDALDRFSKKLFAVDNAPKTSLSPEKSSVKITPSASKTSPISTANNVLNSSDYINIEKRQNEISHELGALKIKEHELLQEFCALKAKMNH